MYIYMHSLTFIELLFRVCTSVMFRGVSQQGLGLHACSQVKVDTCAPSGLEQVGEP